MTINNISIIYVGIILYILLYIFKCIQAYAWGYKLVNNNVCTWSIGSRFGAQAQKVRDPGPLNPVQ